MYLRPNSSFFPVIIGRRRGFTLVEVLVATTLTLILMTAVVTVFGGVGDGIAKSRRALEQFDRLRTAAQQLRVDLQGVTVTMDGRAVRPEENQGYFEVIKSDSDAGADPTAIKRGNIVMFTARNAARLFTGRCQADRIQSDVAEVAWFVRGNTLHRRVLLVVPGIASTIANSAKGTFYANYDISAHYANNQVVPNSLADLTKRENRYAHPASTYPFNASVWGSLGLPTLNECSSTWMAGWVNGSTPPPAGGGAGGNVDLWDSASIQKGALKEDALGTGTRVADDVVLKNVIGFDVKIWQPAAGGAGSYVDLGYDSGCWSYENEGIYNIDNSGNPPTNVPNAGQFTNGLADKGGVVDNDSERLTTPPPFPLRGIQIKIRCFEPDSRLIREITIEQDFLPK